MPALKRVKAAKPEQPAGVRERILAAAFGILQDSGLQRFTQVNVAERAGVRQSHLTYYFPTRQDLLEAVTAEFVAAVTRAATRAVESADRAHGEELLAHLAEKIVDTDHTRMFVAMIIEADGDPTIRSMIASATRSIETALAERIGGRDADERARVVLTAIWGLALYQFVMQPSAKANVASAYLARVRQAVALDEPARKAPARRTTRR